MQVSKVLTLICSIFFTHAALQAECTCTELCYHECNLSQLEFQSLLEHSQTPHFGTATFSSSDDTLWYTITTNSYPETTPLSLNRNNGISEGSVYLSPTGFTIGEAGSYWVSITATFQNNGENNLLIPVFLVEDEILDVENPAQIGGIINLFPNDIASMHGAGILNDIKPGTRISLLATNGGDPEPQDVTVVAWSISLFKMH